MSESAKKPENVKEEPADKDGKSHGVKDGDSNKKSELMIDIFGPIIDISKIPDFKDIPNVRYRHTYELENVLRSLKNEHWKEEKTITAGVEKKIKANVEKTIETNVAEIIETYLDQRFHISIFDLDVLKCVVRAKPHANVRLISGMKKELHDKAKDALKKYSEELCKQLKRKKIEENPTGGAKSSNDLVDFEKLDEGDFERIGPGEEYKSIGDLIKDKNKLGTYRIIFSEEDEILEEDVKARKWLRGSEGEDCVKILKDKVEKMRQIAKAENDLNKLLTNRNTKIEMADYRVDEKFEYYVFDTEERDRLKTRIEEIENILTNEDKLEKGDKPVCIFLAGGPGTGKSYFVELLANKLREDKRYIGTSLSGVSNQMFADAIKRHIDTVYEECGVEAKKKIVAFLDEIDTDGGGGTYAFRFLLEAMTGSVTNDEGKLVRKTEARKLVWVFAGSAKTKREEFIEEFSKQERKVADFFDRIHFYIQLPSVESSGQAILTFLSVLDRPKGRDSINVKREVLYLFGRTSWKSARQIKTVCRIVTNRERFNWDKVLNLDDFRGIDVWKDFVITLEAIDNLKKDNDLELNLNEPIIIKFS